VSQAQQRGRAPQASGSAGVSQVFANPAPQWRYLALLLLGNEGGAAEVEVAWNSPIGPTGPTGQIDATLLAGQLRLIDTGVAASRQLWVAGLSPSAELWYVADTDPILEMLAAAPQPLWLGNLVGTAAGVTGTFAIPPWCRSLKLIPVPGNSVAATTLKVLGEGTAATYYDAALEEQEDGAWLPILLPVDGASEPSVQITFTGAFAPRLTLVALPGGAGVANDLATPLFVQASPAQRSTSAISQTQRKNLSAAGTFFSWSSPARYVRGFTAHWKVVAPSASGEVVIRLQGHVSGVFMDIDAVAVISGQAGETSHVKDYGDRPIDLGACFTDVVVDVLYVTSAGTGVTCELVMEVTP
jgi:hypothetical protein